MREGRGVEMQTKPLQDPMREGPSQEPSLMFRREGSLTVGNPTSPSRRSRLHQVSDEDKQAIGIGGERVAEVTVYEFGGGN